MGGTAIEVSAVIDGRRYPREAVLDWEARRLPRAAAKIGLAVPSGSLERRRLAFAESKIELGAEEVRRRLRRDLSISDAISAATSRLSAGKRVMSVCDLHATTGSAAEFVQWFTDTARPDYVRSMIAANPDHFLIRTAPDGTQEVVETTGGSPLATRFFVDYTDLSALASTPDGRFTAQAAGVAVSEGGRPIGGVRHQFRDEPGGFHARLCVEFPRLLAPHMISQHRWHLAAEFSNWIEFAFRRGT
ncbi:hypothetical protein ACIBF1_09340 [Spirillospora sp. NPDC050679]